jgi:hypothetical protein
MVDTNILVRLANPSDQDYLTAESAVTKLSAGGDTFASRHKSPPNSVTSQRARHR